MSVQILKKKYGVFLKEWVFSKMNKDNTFSILRHDTSITKQIDVFAKDEQCISII